MCLYTNMQNPFIAKTDIRIYKWVDDNLRAPVSGFDYKLGTMYGNPLHDIYQRAFRVDKAFHAYTSFKAALDNPWFSYGYCTAHIIMGVVPKGSMYYLSSLGDEIASNQVIYWGIAYTQPASTASRSVSAALVAFLGVADLTF